MIIVFMPAFNEAATIGRLLASMPSGLDGNEIRTIVLNDGSTDATSDVARGSGVEVIDFPENRGKGSVLKFGFDLIRDEPFDAVVLMDADGQHDPGCFEDVVRPVLGQKLDVVVGSRYLEGRGRGSTPRNRYLVRIGVRWALRLFVGADVTDPFSGYRALSPRALQCVHLYGDRYESELEILFCAQGSALRLGEVPIPKIYGPRTSKMGSRYGSLLGRVDVVSRYVVTIAREVVRSRRAATPAPRTWRPHERAD